MRVFKAILKIYRLTCIRSTQSIIRVSILIVFSSSATDATCFWARLPAAVREMSPRSSPKRQRPVSILAPQSPRSIWTAPRIETSGRPQHRKSAINGLTIKSEKSDWLKIQNEHSAHVQKLGKWIAGSERE